MDFCAEHLTELCFYYKCCKEDMGILLQQLPCVSMDPMLHEYLKLFDPISHALESAQMNRFVCDTPASQGISSKVDFASTCPPTPARDVTKIQIEHFPFPHLLHP